MTRPRIAGTRLLHQSITDYFKVFPVLLDLMSATLFSRKILSGFRLCRYHCATACESIGYSSRASLSCVGELNTAVFE